MSKARQLADLGNQVDDGAITGTNMVINGAMTVAQRGNLTGIGSSSYFVDRFQYVGTDECTWSLSQVSDAPSGTGLTNSLKLENTVADTNIIAGDYAQLRHKFENQDVKHLMKGTANAKPVTLSFWVKASIAQDYSVRMRDNYSSTSRHNIQQFTLASINTWQKVTMTFAGDTGGDDFSGSDDILPNFIIDWMLGAGSDYQGGTPNAGWEDINNANFDATDTFLSTVNSTFQITGVCLNVGDSAIDFPHESYGDTLAKCQRFFQRFGNLTGNTINGICNLNVRSATDKYAVIHHPVVPRAQPTVGYSSLSHFILYAGASSTTPTAFTYQGTTASGSTEVQINTNSFGSSGWGGWLRLNSSTGYLDFDMEL